MNPNATITDEMFEAYLKQIRELVEGPFEEMQKEIEVTNKFPDEFFLPNMAGGTSTNLRSCACRRSSLVVLVACVCTFIMRQT